MIVQYVIIFRMADRNGSVAPSGYSKRLKGSCHEPLHLRALSSPVSIKAINCLDASMLKAVFCVHLTKKGKFYVDKNFTMGYNM